MKKPTKMFRVTVDKDGLKEDFTVLADDGLTASKRVLHSLKSKLKFGYIVENVTFIREIGNEEHR